LKHFALEVDNLPFFSVVRTLTGHRSNCISVDFHPFGEFFASGSLDTNLKIWDIRRKGCIHTYKGHTRGVNAIRFTPDGRWVVSGGEDNTVKVIFIGRQVLKKETNSIMYLEFADITFCILHKSFLLTAVGSDC
jgi:WD40 repeat protein